MIVPRLREIQDRHGYLPDADLDALARETGTPLYRIQEIASFFPHFRQEWNPPPYVEVKVCRDMSCHLAGAAELLHSNEGLKQYARDGEKPVLVEGVSCLGRCDRAPALCVSRSDLAGDRLSSHSDSFHDYVYAGRTSGELHEIVQAIVDGQAPAPPDLDAQFKVDRTSWQIDPYSKSGEFEPYAAVRALVRQIPSMDEPHPFLKRLETAGLLGMGGAGVPAFRKWKDVWQAKATDGSGIKYVVCNGDESEPATFKDREILLQMPHLVVEGVILAGLTTQATAGFIFIRHEYGEQIEAVQKEIRQAEIVGACGRDVFGSGRSFSVQVFVSPGGYICGEQSALLEAMEDRRAQPRNRPPELSVNGLHDRPTVVNNVETLAWTPAVMLRGGEWYAKAGETGFKGRRLFSICGDIVRPGVYEVQVGITLGNLIEKAGGVRGGGPPKALATSGPSGGLFPRLIPLPRHHEAEKEFRDRLKQALSEIADRDLRQQLSRLFDSLLPKGAGHLDLLSVPLDKAVFGILARAFGAPLMLGAGLAVYAQRPDLDILDHALRMTEFFRNESCGKCVPCRIGSQKLVDLGTDLMSRRSTANRHEEEVVSLAATLTVTSICGLGQVAANPLLTALRFFAGSSAESNKEAADA